MSNYPDGVYSWTEDAPWNDQDLEIEVEVTLRTVIPLSYKGSVKLTEGLIKQDVEEKIKDELKDLEYYSLANIYIL